MRRGQDGGAWVIVISMLLVIVGAVTLVVGVFFAGDNLQLVYVSIISCLLAGLFLVAGIIRGRSSGKAATAGAGEAPAPTSAWSPSGAGAAQGWGGAAAQDTQVNEPAAPTVGASPAGQADAHAPGPDESWAPEGDPLEDVGQGDVRILEPDEAGTEVEPEGEVAQEDALRAQAPPEPEVAPPKSVAKKTARKGAGKKATKAGGKKAAGKKAAGKKAASAKKATGKKGATAGKKTSKKATSAKKAAGKKAATAGKKAAGKKAAASGKQRIDTALADVSGVGDAKRQALADHFGSYQRLRNASEEEITEVRGISPTLAKRIYDGLRS